jgi:hypothetical protein
VGRATTGAGGSTAPVVIGAPSEAGVARKRGDDRGAARGGVGDDVDTVKEAASAAALLVGIKATAVVNLEIITFMRIATPTRIAMTVQQATLRSTTRVTTHLSPCFLFATLFLVRSSIVVIFSIGAQWTP